MLRHIVLLRVDATDQNIRSDRSRQLIDALEALPQHITEIRALSVNANVVVRPGNWDLALVVDVDDA
ncbi:MAG: Dabb family protein, partial [Terrimesophilobacter sp.]